MCAVVAVVVVAMVAVIGGGYVYYTHIVCVCIVIHTPQMLDDHRMDNYRTALATALKTSDQR